MSIVAWMTPTSVNAQGRFYDIGDLVPFMQDYERVRERRGAPTPNAEYGLYYAYILAVYESQQPSGCADRIFNGEQIAAIVSKYIKDNPAVWAEPADEVIEKALRMALKCYSGYFMKTDRLLEHIRDYENFRVGAAHQAFGVSFLRGYVAGIQDSKKHLICPSDPNFNIDRATEVVIRYIKDRPERWNQLASITVSEALTTSFSCIKR